MATLLADCYGQLGQDERVISVLTPVETAHPEDMAVAWLLGSAMIRAGHKRDGLERVDRVARQSKNPEAYLLAGQTALKMNEFERARDYADAALKLNPQLPVGLIHWRGTVLKLFGRYAGEPPWRCGEAVTANPNDFDALVALGAVLHTERDLDGARENLQRALLLKPDSNLARYEWARLERTEGHVEEALKDMEKVVHDDPNWAQPHVELAALYFKLNRQADGERERATFDRLSAGQQKP